MSFLGNVCLYVYIPCYKFWATLKSFLPENKVAGRKTYIDAA